MESNPINLMQITKHKIKDLNFVISCIGKNDGFGAQFLNLMHAIAFAKFHGREYKHSNFKDLEHGVFPEEAENFINFNDAFDPVTPSDIPLYFSHISEVADHGRPEKYFTPNVLKQLREIFLKNKQNSVSFPNQIAIHIRRGDVTSKDFLRWVPLQYYQKIIRYLEHKYPSHEIVIYSEGLVEEFSALKAKNLKFKLNGSALEIFLEMVNSDILITSKSAFSYSAAILSIGKIYYTPFWHAPLPNWKRIIVKDSFLAKIKDKIIYLYLKYILHFNAYFLKFLKRFIGKLIKLKFLLLFFVKAPIDIFTIKKNIQFLISESQAENLKVGFDFKSFPYSLGVYANASINFKEIYWEDINKNYLPLCLNPYVMYLDVLLNEGFDKALMVFTKNFPDLSKNEVMELINSFNEKIISYKEDAAYYQNAKLSFKKKIMLPEDSHYVILSMFFGTTNKVNLKVFF